MIENKRLSPPEHHVFRRQAHPPHYFQNNLTKAPLDVLDDYVKAHPEDAALKEAVALTKAAAAAAGPATLTVGASAEAGVSWWLGTRTGNGSGLSKSGSGRFVGVDVPSTFTGGGTFTLVVSGTNATLTLVDALSNTTVYRGSGQSTNLDGTYTGTWA